MRTMSTLARRAVARLLDLRYIGWDIGVRAMERASGHRRGEHLDFKLSASARDLLSSKSRAVRGEVEALRLRARVGKRTTTEDKPEDKPA